MRRMTQRRLSFEAPDRFVTGAIGPPGARAFYLQAREGRAVTTVALEKVQVAALAARMSELLDAVDAGAEGPAAPRPDDDPLEDPVRELFRVGDMVLSWNPETERIAIEAHPQQADEGQPAVLRVQLEPPAAREFVRRATAIVGAGRPACPFCGQPLDPTGHFCAATRGQLN